MHLHNIFYLVLYTFSFEIEKSSLSDTRRGITTPVVIKKWYEIAHDFLCQTTLSWHHSIGMWGKTHQCKGHTFKIFPDTTI